MSWQRLILVPALVLLALGGWPTQARAVAEWTVMVYLMADNNLECGALDGFAKLAAAGSDDKVNIVVQFDRAKGYCDKDIGYDDWTTCKRFYITKDLKAFAANALEDLGEVNMCDPETLTDFINWAAAKYPAKRYALWLSGHGGGFAAPRESLYRVLPYATTEAEREAIQKRLADLKNMPITRVIGPDEDPPGSGYLSNKRMKQGLLEANARMDVLYLEACEMAYLETAYELKDTGPSVMVASEPLGWGNDWTAILTELKKNPLWTPVQLASCIVDHYGVSIEGKPGDHEMAAIDLTQIQALAGKASNLGDVLRFNWDRDQYAVQAAAKDVMAAIKSAVLRKSKDIPVFRCNGLKIWFPETKTRYDTDIKIYHSDELDFGMETNWDLFIEAFYTKMIPSWVSAARWASQQFRPFDVDLYDFCQKLAERGITLWEALDCALLTWSTGGDGEFPGWVGQKSTSISGGDAAQSLNRQPNTATWLRTTVTGPGTVSFYWKVSSEANFDFLTFSIDGVPKDRISGEKDWQKKSFLVPAGRHILEWRYAKDGSQSVGLDCGWLDAVYYTINLGTVLDIPGLSFTTGGNANWLGQDRTYLIGGSAAQSPKIGDGQASWMQCQVYGPKLLVFYWKVSSEADKDFLEFLVDGNSVDSISGEKDWQLVKMPLAKGLHTLKWQYRKDGSKSWGQDCGWVDYVAFLSQSSLNTALDNAELIFTTGGDLPWFSQQTTSVYGGSAAQSGPIGDNQSSWLETVIFGPGTLSFYTKISSEAGHDKLIFTSNGADLMQIQGEFGWYLKTVDFPPGVHLLRWTYAKDSSSKGGSDCAWVDQVEYTRTGGDLSPVLLLLLGD